MIEKILEIEKSDISYFDKIKQIKNVLIEDISKYVIENSKYKIGDIIKIKIEKFNFVVTQLGYNVDGIVYYGKRIKNNGEISNISMYSEIGVPERMILQSSIKKGNETIYKIDLPTNPIDNQIRVNI